MKLKRVYSNVIPFKEFLAMTVFPWVFIRKDKRQKYTPTVNRHECTHGYQQIEMFVVGCIIAIALCFLECGWWSLIPLGLFFEWYLLEWIIKLPLCTILNRNAYKSISFEQEAYTNQGKVDYNKSRKHFAWIKCVFTLK